MQQEKKDLEKELKDKTQHIKNQEAQIALLEQRMHAMEGSKFWKLRSFYLRIKNFRLRHVTILFEKAWNIYKTDGLLKVLSYTLLYLQHGRSYFQASVDPQSYDHWIMKNEDEDLDLIKKEIKQFSFRPKISIIAPSFNIDPLWMEKCFESVLNQYYENWELCIYDDASTKKEVLTFLKKWEEKDDRIKIVYGKQNEHISGASNHAISFATGEYMGLLDCDDLLSKNALYEVVKLLQKYPDAEMIYSDEDKIDTKEKRYNPFFKPDWSSVLLRSMMYTSHFSVYKKSVVDSVGGFRKGFEGSQDYDLALRVVDSIDQKNIFHIPKILYHWRAIEGSTAESASNKSYITVSGKKALQEHLQRNNIEATVEIVSNAGRYRIDYAIQEHPLISIIIPFRDQAAVLQTCVESVLEKTTYDNYEILLVDNQSEEKETLDFLEKIKSHKKIRLLTYNEPFNYSAINNYAATKASGEYVLLLNNDTEVITPTWIEEMLAYAMQPSVGAVGAKLLFHNDTIQHAGVTLGVGGIAGHAFKYFDRHHDGYFSLLQVARNVSAVTAACLLIKKRIFEEVEGLDEKNLSVAFNDVDFCLRVMKAGYQNIYTPYAELYHYESLTRGNDDELYAQNPKKFERVKKERKYMSDNWKYFLNKDPYYNINLTDVHEDYSIKEIK